MTDQEYLELIIDEFKTALLKTTERIINTLFLLNGGGIITILTYIYNTKLNFQWLQPHVVALFLFLGGELLAFILVALDHFYAKAALKRIKEVSYRTTNPQDRINELVEYFSKSKVQFILSGLGVFSGLAFFAGVIFSIISVFTMHS